MHRSCALFTRITLLLDYPREELEGSGEREGEGKEGGRKGSEGKEGEGEGDGMREVRS